MKQNQILLEGNSCLFISFKYSDHFLLLFFYLHFLHFTIATLVSALFCWGQNTSSLYSLTLTCLHYVYFVTAAITAAAAAVVVIIFCFRSKLRFLHCSTSIYRFLMDILHYSYSSLRVKTIDTNN